MPARPLARFIAVSRIAVGAAFLSQPEIWMRPWIGRDASRPTARMLARAVGARDLVLGAGTLASADQDLRRWLASGLVADSVDLLLTVTGREHLPRRGSALVTVIASSGVALGAVALAGAGRPLSA